MKICTLQSVIYSLLNCVLLIPGRTQNVSGRVAGLDMVNLGFSERKPFVIFEKCFDGLGCVQLTPEWYHTRYRPSNVLPSDRVAVNTQFIHWFLTDGNLSSSVIHNLDDNKDLKLLIHDFTSNGYAEWIRHLAKALLSRPEDASVVSVHWAPGAEPPYIQAVANARLVALEITHFLSVLMAKHNRIAVDAVGHGLGAHIAGYVGKLNSLQRITALDPSGPYFLNMPPNVRLHKQDALIVEVIHTDIDGQGYPDLIGDIDFYPNGGRQQPGCMDPTYKITSIRRDSLRLGETLPACSHKRSLKYYIESLVHPKCRYLGISCGSYKTFLKGKCTACGANMEYCSQMPARKAIKQFNNTNGYFFVTTRSPPFCVEVLKVLLLLKDKNKPKSYLKGYFNITIPQEEGNVNFYLNENHPYNTLTAEGQQVFVVFRSVPPPLETPIDLVHVKFVQKSLTRSRSKGPKVLALMIIKMSDVDDEQPQWFCPTGVSERPWGLNMLKCDHAMRRKIDEIYVPTDLGLTISG